MLREDFSGGLVVESFSRSFVELVEGVLGGMLSTRQQGKEADFELNVASCSPCFTM